LKKKFPRKYATRYLQNVLTQKVEEAMQKMEAITQKGIQERHQLIENQQKAMVEQREKMALHWLRSGH
jgi:hypothetical protein